MATARGARWIQQHRAIAAAHGLSTAQKAILWAFIGYADPEGEAFPAAATLAGDAALSERHTRRVLGELEHIGVLVPLSRGTGGVTASGRGISTRRRVCLRTLSELTQAKGDTDGQEGRHSSPARVTLATEKGDTMSPKPPSNHHGSHQMNHQGNGEQSARADGMHAVEAETTRDALAACGVQGKNLSRLARIPSLSPAQVRRRFAEIRCDPKVRSPSAVLTRRLADECEIELNSGPRLDAESAAALGRIEQRQRDLQNSRVGNDIVA